MQNALLSLFSVILLTCSTTANAQLIVAHRGASYDAPENTLAAFRLAWEQQADAIEGDFYVTKDKQIVCIHDKTTKRVARQQLELHVASSTLDELRQVDVGSWKGSRFANERIPTLQEVLTTVPNGKQIFVEIKCGLEILPLIRPQLIASGLKPEQIVIICFDQTVISECRRTMPGFKANWLTGYKQSSKQSEWKPGVNEVIEILKKTEAIGLGTNANRNVVDQAFVSRVCEAGFEFHVWTVNDIESARYFANLQASSITTDRPAFIRNAIQPAPTQVP